MDVQLEDTDVIKWLTSAVTSGRVYYDTYAQLATVAGKPLGAMAEVLPPDTGFHADVVSGTSVPNAGVYKKSTAGWQWITDRVLGMKGDPGGNSMAVGSFSEFATLSVPNGTDRIMARNGAEYIYDAFVNAVYVAANPRTAVITSNGRGFRLDPDQRLRAAYFGAIADFTGDPATATDNFGALTAAATFRQRSNVGRTAPIWLDAGKYYCSQRLEVSGSFEFRGIGGPGGGALEYFGPTWIVTPTNVSCVKLKSNNAGVYGNSITTLYGIVFAQLTQGNDLAAHAIDASCRVHVECCAFVNIAGDGLHIEAFTNGAGRYGEASNWVSLDNFAHSVGGDGQYIGGADANIGYCRGLHTQVCGFAGIRDQGYFVNVYVGCHLAGYGTGGVQYNGRQWQPLADNLGVTPGTDQYKWQDRGPLASPNAAFPAYSAGTTYRARGPAIVTGPATIIGTYIEGGVTYGYAHGPRATVVGNDMGWTPMTATLGVNEPVATSGPMVCPTGIGQRRGTSGDATNPAYATIGEQELTVLGYRGDARGATSRSALLFHEMKGVRTLFDYENNGGNLVWRTVGAEEVFGITTMSASAMKFGRKAAQPNRMYFNGYSLKSRTDTGITASFDISDAAPTFGNYKQGDRIFNSNPTVGGVDYWVCTTSGAIAQAAWSSDYYLLGYVAGSDGKAWVVSNRGTGQSLSAPTGSVTFTDPTTGMVWEPVTTAFMFTARNL